MCWVQIKFNNVCLLIVNAELHGYQRASDVDPKCSFHCIFVLFKNKAVSRFQFEFVHTLKSVQRDYWTHYLGKTKQMSQITFHIIVWLVWWLWDTIKCGSSSTFMIMEMIHSSTTVSVCLRGLHVRGVFSAHGLHLCGLWFRTCCSWTPPSAFSQSRVWTTTPSRPCGWWSGLGHPHPHLYVPLRENLTTETTLPPAGQQWALYLGKACQCRCINGSFREQNAARCF